MLALSLMASNGCPPGLVLYQEQAIQKAIQPLLSTPMPRAEMIRSTFLTLTPCTDDDLFKSASEFYEYDQFVKSACIRRMPLLVNVQGFSAHSVICSPNIDERWTKYQQILQLLLLRSSALKECSLTHCLLSDLMGLQALPADVHLQDIASTDFEFNRLFLEHASLLQEADCNLLNDLPSTISVHPDGQLPFVGNMADLMDQASVLADFPLTKGTNGWRKQKMLVPRFRWNDAIELQDHIFPSSLKLESVIAAPLKSPQKAKPKTAPKRKNKKTARERDLSKNSSLHACEILLSLMMDKKRNGKLVLNSLKKSAPELPQLLTQFSASIAGTGLAVVFTVLYKVASGTAPFGTPNVLTSSFGVGLLWVSCAVNKLRDTVIYIRKNAAKLGFEEEEMMRRVDKSVKDIFFRAVASMAILMLRFS